MVWWRVISTDGWGRELGMLLLVDITAMFYLSKMLPTCKTGTRVLGIELTQDLETKRATNILLIIFMFGIFFPLCIL